jgi:hypothetical protein
MAAIACCLLAVSVTAARAPKPDLEAMKVHWQCVADLAGDANYGWFECQGVIRNNSANTYQMVTVEVSCIDSVTKEKSDKTELAVLWNVQPGDVVKFAARPAYCFDKQSVARGRYVGRIDRIKGTLATE